MTSSISNSKRKLLLWSFLLLLGCSSKPQKSSDEAELQLSEELNTLSKNVQTQNYGPTVKESTSFIDRTNDYGLEGLYAVSMNAVDLNFDGKSDLMVLPFYYASPKFFIFDKTKKKFELWKHDPLPRDFKASFLLIHDFNKDRVPDLVSGVLNQRSEVTRIPLKFYRGEVKNGKLYFRDDPDAIKLPAEPTSSVSIIDYDLDGWADLFVSNWFESKSGQFYPVADRLLRNNGKGKFEEVTHLLKGEAVKASNQIYPPNAKPTYGSSTCDIDHNGFPDILTVSSSGHKNKLWMNHKENRTDERYFEDIGLATNYASDPEGMLVPTGGGRSFFSACADYNDDGLMDIFLGELSHAYDNESVDRSSVLTGSRETYPPYFLRTEYVSDATNESWNQGDRRGIWLDYNLDGRIDILVENSGFPPYSRLVMFEQDEGHAFINVASQLGIDIVNPMASITLDLNDDGKPDFITSQNNIRRSDIPPRLYVFENNMQTKGKKSIKVHLHGIKSNTQGIGALVMLYTVSKTDPSKKIIQRRWVEYFQGGLPSQNESGVMFGVSENMEVSGIKVRWPYQKKRGYGAGEIIEKLYTLKEFRNKEFIEITLCEDGSEMAGKLSCKF
ncbi:MAG TPA: CRTAC1 family protein [Bacteriovoracaceae bacterium]|nr:CRTAC1 family protein [Bacteriovoracaceae bacterium]